jgi:hypothetical protein
MAFKDSKTIHEAFSRFFEKPTRESLRMFLREHVGELRNCDFKEDWPEHSSLAKHLLGIGNAGGGCLVFGVTENDDKTTSPKGLPAIKDKADISNGVKPYLPEPLHAAVEIADFKYEASEYPALVGKLFQVVFVHDRSEFVPFVAKRTGTGIRSGSIYVRREGQTEEATYEELQRLIDRRVGASPETAMASSIKEHLQELKVLYAEVPRFLATQGTLFLPLSEEIGRIARMFGGSRPNPDYPKEDYQSFVLRLIESKKLAIEELAGIPRKN